MDQVGRILCDGDGNSGKPAIIALQEVTAELIGILRPHIGCDAEHTRAPNAGDGSVGSYSMFVQDHPCAVALGVREPLGPLCGARFSGFKDNNSGRRVALARTDWPGVGTIVVGTTHLESGWSDNKGGQAESYAIRARQLLEAAAMLTKEATACSARAVSPWVI